VEEHDALAAAVNEGYYPTSPLRENAGPRTGRCTCITCVPRRGAAAIKDLVAEIAESLDNAEPEGRKSPRPTPHRASRSLAAARQLLLSDPEATGGSPNTKPGDSAGKQSRKEDSMDPLDELVSG
jgi:hypothetical protein